MSQHAGKARPDANRRPIDRSDDWDSAVSHGPHCVAGDSSRIRYVHQGNVVPLRSCSDRIEVGATDEGPGAGARENGHTDILPVVQRCEGFANTPKRPLSTALTGGRSMVSRGDIVRNLTRLPGFRSHLLSLCEPTEKAHSARVQISADERPARSSHSGFSRP